MLGELFGENNNYFKSRLVGIRKFVSILAKKLNCEIIIFKKFSQI